MITENKEYINIQTKEVLDMGIVCKLEDNKMLKNRLELFELWSFEKNKEIGLDVYKVTKAIRKKPWWYCNTCKGEYPQSVRNKLRGNGCAICAGKFVTEVNSLATLKPSLALEWHPTKNGDKTPNDFVCGSHEKVWWQCQEHQEHVWETKIELRNKGYGCPYCANAKVHLSNCLATLNPTLAKQWHPTKNGNLTPYDVTSSKGEKVWWLGECGHEWKAKISNRNLLNSSCPYCSNTKLLVGFNDMWTTNPELASMLLNPEDGYKYMQSSTVSVDWKCQDCDSLIKGKFIDSIKNQRLSCPICNDGSSKPEKIMFNVLRQLNIEFYNEKTFEWSQGKRYDFYIPKQKRIDVDIIIEMQGRQHTEKGMTYRDSRILQEEIVNDKLKLELSKENNIGEYIAIDCKISELEYIKPNIINSKLASLLNISEVDWTEVDKLSQNSWVIESIELWNSGSSISEIMNIMKKHRVTIESYLNTGNRIGKCSYSKKENREREIGFVNKPIVKISRVDNLLATYNSIHDITNLTDPEHLGIIKCCHNIQKTSHGFKWMYKDDYDSMIKSK